jgi:hypothetical protein
LAVLAEKLEIRKYLLARDAVHSESEKQRDLLDKNPQPSDSATEEQSATSLDADAHMYANHLEAILGAVYLDGGLSATQQLIAQLFFPEEELQKVWLDYPPHPLQVRVCIALKYLSRMRLPHNCIVIALFPGVSKKIPAVLSVRSSCWGPTYDTSFSHTTKTGAFGRINRSRIQAHSPTGKSIHAFLHAIQSSRQRELREVGAPWRRYIAVSGL